jgi:hypothetical protein
MTTIAKGCAWVAMILSIAFSLYLGWLGMTDRIGVLPTVFGMCFSMLLGWISACVSDSL